MTRRLAVIMAADLVGYTALMRKSESMALSRLRSLREQLFEPVATAHGGEILKRLGDGWIVAFTSASGAIAAAQAVQTGLARQSEAELRIGLHLGDLVEGEDDWHGDCINIAARLQGEAQPGGILVSGDIVRLMDRESADAFAAEGALDLKNVDLAIDGYSWRPPAMALAPVQGMPRMWIAEPEVQPATGEACLMAEDAMASIEFRLSRRTGLQLASDPDETDYVLRSRFRTAGARLRATMTLLWPDGDERLWTATVDGSANDPLAWIDAITDRTDTALRFHVNARDGRRVADLDPEDLDVNGLLTRAAARFYRLTEEGYREGNRLAAMALEREPDNAMALAMWAESKTTLKSITRAPISAEEAADIRTASERAASLNPASDYGLMALSLARSLILHDFRGAAAAAERTLELSPAYCYGHSAAAIASLGMGDVDAALPQARKASEFGSEEAFLPQFLALRATAEALAGKFEEAESSIAAAILRAPGHRSFLELRAVVLSALGRSDAASAIREARDTPFVPSPMAFDYPMPPELRERLVLPRDGT